MRIWRLALVAAFISGAGQAQDAAKPLFASDAPIAFTIQGPVDRLVNRAARSTEAEAATLTLAAPAETHQIRLSPRGLSRRKGDICSFPPLRIEFAQPPAPGSLFAGQRRLKLVTHCRSSASFQQHLLLEYSVYRLMNQITPQSYRVRLATVNYAEPNGKVTTSRYGFLIEDVDDVARRVGLTEARVGDRIQPSQLEPSQAARVALFQYMIGNLDWSMRAGPEGEGCCHNGRLLAGKGSYVPVPYDFDFSGLVDAPYAVAPDQVPVKNVRTRYYMGYCRHNSQALAAAAEFRAKRANLEAVFAQVPGMTDKTRSKSLDYLGKFFADIATDDVLRSKVLKNCA